AARCPNSSSRSSRSGPTSRSRRSSSIRRATWPRSPRRSSTDRCAFASWWPTSRVRCRRFASRGPSTREKTLAESPFATLSRVLPGVVLMQGHLGHQVLGQLLVTNTNEVVIAGAALVVAATTSQRSVVGQMALRTVAPALAVRVLLNRQEERLER